MVALKGENPWKIMDEVTKGQVAGGDVVGIIIHHQSLRLPGRQAGKITWRSQAEDGKIPPFFTIGCDELVDPCFGNPFPAGLSCENI